LEELEGRLMDRWPHQLRGHAETTGLLESGANGICVTAPTGAGKSLMMVDLIEWAVREKGWNVSLYTNRRMLTEQLIRVFESHGVSFGVRAAGYDDYYDSHQKVQICSSATENARVFRRRKQISEHPDIANRLYRLSQSDLDIFDEVHMQKGEVVQRICREKEAEGAKRVAFTATPLEISNLFPHLVVAGTNSELRRCGAHVPCHVRAPDEPDLRKIKREKTGEYSINDIRKYIWTQQIYGRVWEHWEMYNPDARPAILFAPGVDESIHFAKHFEKRGVRWAHIDGESVYLDGKEYKKARNALKDISGQLEDGTLKGVSNRFVMREGIDVPCLYHCILATPIGSVLSYVQTVGRVLRAHSSLDHVVLQDHGGNWWRHGSPNADRDWKAVYNTPTRVVTDMRLDRIRDKKEPEPIRCPKCSTIRAKGPKCPQCGFEHTKNGRTVLQTNGDLKEVEGAIIAPRRVAMKADTNKLWIACYKRWSKNGTFKQAEGLFFYENHYYPPPGLPFMPKNDDDWYRKISDVPKERLHGYEEAVAKRQPSIF
jgi:DNA repair protein RadD